MKYFSFLALNLWSVVLFAQANLVGKVTGNGGKEVLIGANVYWQGSNIGVFTNAKGQFSIENNLGYDSLVCSYVGFKTKTISRSDFDFPLQIDLSKSVDLDGVVIEEHVNSKQILTLEPLQIERITQKELKKAACCNLSESFETNPSVDVNFADAISGAKRVRMLGLDGVYSLITIENIPDVHGLAASYGLTAIPGPWIESIQLAKGVGSVVNGYEAITGQINVELMKPYSAPKFHFNGYANSVGRFETSLNGQFKLSEKWSTIVMAHTNSYEANIDDNNDGFLDMPKIRQLTATNRWMYYNDVIESQFGIEVFTEGRQAGQLMYSPMQEHNTNNPWGLNVEQKRFKAYAKIGVLPTEKHPERSIGFINKFSHYTQEGNYGLKFYSGTNNYWYSNLIFQDKIINKYHSIKLGASFFIDDYKENLDDKLNGGIVETARNERSGGAFAEYTYVPNIRFTLIAGGRIDYNNLFGAFATPRLHLRYKLKRNLTWRFAAGSGQRTPNLLVDNSRVMVSSRRIVFPASLQQEKAWNIGNSLVYDFKLFDREAIMTIDAYHTEFTNMLIMDMDADISTLRFYNLNGRSFSSVAQAEVNYELLKRLDIRASYKVQNVQGTFSDGKLNTLPFVAKNVILLNSGYTTKNRKWNFDATAVRTNPGRLAESINTEGFDTPYPFWKINAQATFGVNGMEIYLGGENLTGFTQKNPIISASNPFDATFDAANVWAPIFGRMIYLGVRYTHF